jgi:hypothetical protein
VVESLVDAQPSEQEPLTVDSDHPDAPLRPAGLLGLRTFTAYIFGHVPRVVLTSVGASES